MSKEAVIYSLIPALLVAIGTAIQQLATDNTAEGIAAAVAALLIAVGGISARAHVYSQKTVDEMAASQRSAVTQ